MPARCWVIVVDDGPAFGPTLAQGFCLLMPALPGRMRASDRCCFVVGPAS